MKKVLKIIGIVFLCIISLLILSIGALMIKNYIDSQKTWLENEYYTAFQSDSALERKYADIGSYNVSHMKIKSGDDMIKNYRIWYPYELENKNQEYPLIIVTNGSNTAALNYKSFFERLASWGFIVAGNDDRQSGTGLSTSKTLDYIAGLNDNPDSIFYKKISQDNIGVVGYSQGGAGAIKAVTAFENSNKYKAIFTGSAAYAFLSRNMGWEYDISKIAIPYFMTAGTGKSDDIGAKDTSEEFGGVAPLSSLVENYNAMTNDAFKVRGRVVDAEHGEMQIKTDGYMTAWMLYHLQGDEEAGKVFLGDDAEILNNTNWQDVQKND